MKRKITQKVQKLTKYSKRKTVQNLKNHEKIIEKKIEKCLKMRNHTS